MVSLSPALDQLFFIGDGLTGPGTGSIQDFIAPAGAGTLYLSISDLVGAAGNNSGSIGVDVAQTSPLRFLSQCRSLRPSQAPLLEEKGVAARSAKVWHRRENALAFTRVFFCRAELPDDPRQPFVRKWSASAQH